MQEQSPQHITSEQKPFHWDWWRENPREIILVIFVIVLFMAVPWEGCGITQQPLDPDELSVVG